MFVKLCQAGASLLLILVFACGEEPAVSRSDLSLQYQRPNPGEPFAGLTPDQLTLFIQGGGEFVRERIPADGLGPVFVERSCVACHGQGAVGGADPLDDLNHLVERFGTLNAAGGYDPLASLGGDVLQTQSVSAEAPGCAVAPEMVPTAATIHALRNPLPTFGLGLVAAIPSSAILAGAVDKGDGVHGRPNLDAAGNPGRFGWKAQTNELAPFNATAANGTMGLTSSFSPNEQLPQGVPAPSGCTNADLGATSPNDPIGEAILAITAWEVMLAPIEPARPLNAARRRGRDLFAEIGCAKCHVASMQTGDFSVPIVGGGTLHIDAVSNKSADLYSDLLLHDMGPGLDEQVVMRQAGGRDFRTAMLWGINLRTRFLHDGRAGTIHEAIAAHGGEAQIIRDRYLGLTKQKRHDLRRFVRNL